MIRTRENKMGSFRIEQAKFGSVQTRIRPADAPVQRIQSISKKADEAGTFTPQPGLTNDLIKKLPGSVLRKIEPHIKKVSFSSGEYIYRPDEKIDWLYFPESAVISELQILEDGRTI